jgi:WD40 repeat protein
LRGHLDGIWSLKFLSLPLLGLNGRVLFSGSSDTTIRIWHLDTSACVKILEGHSGDVYSIDARVISSHEKGYKICLVSGSADQSVHVREFSITINPTKIPPGTGVVVMKGSSSSSASAGGSGLNSGAATPRSMTATTPLSSSSAASLLASSGLLASKSMSSSTASLSSVLKESKTREHKRPSNHNTHDSSDDDDGTHNTGDANADAADDE